MTTNSITYINPQDVAHEIDFFFSASVQTGSIEFENRPFVNHPVYQIKIGNKLVYSYESPYCRIYILSIICFTSMVYFSHFANVNNVSGFMSVLSLPALFYLEHNDYFSEIMERKCALLRNITYFSTPRGTEFVALSSQSTNVAVAKTNQPFNLLITAINKLGGLNLLQPDYPMIQSNEHVYVNRFEIFRQSDLGLLFNDVIFGVADHINTSYQGSDTNKRKLHTKIIEKHRIWRHRITEHITDQINAYLSDNNLKPQQLSNVRFDANDDITPKDNQELKRDRIITFIN